MTVITPEDKTIGRNLRRFRHERKLSQTDVADALDLTFQQIQKYEWGVNRLSGARIMKVCTLLQITPAQLFGHNSPVDPRDCVGQMAQSRVGVELARAFNRIKSAEKRAVLLDVAKKLGDAP